MSERDPASLYRLITTEIWCNRRYELVDELIDEDFVDHIEAQGLEEKAGLVTWRRSVLSTRRFPDYHEEAEFIVADRDMAVGYARLTGTHDGDLMGLQPTGRKIDVHSIGILRFRDGQVMERWGIGESLTQMQQLGVFGRPSRLGARTAARSRATAAADRALRAGRETRNGARSHDVAVAQSRVERQGDRARSGCC